MLVTLGLILGLVVVLALQVVTSRRVQRLTLPIYEYAEEKSQKEAERIVSEAKNTARKILADATSAGAQLSASQHADIEAFAQSHKASLESMHKDAAHSLEEAAETARTSLAKIVEASEHDLGAEREGIQAALASMARELSEISNATKAKAMEMKTTLDEGNRGILDTLNTVFEESAASGKKRIDARIDALLGEAERDVAAYRDVRKKLVDERLADLVADATKIVLQKTLSPDEHADLVLKSLKEARADGLL